MALEDTSLLLRQALETLQAPEHQQQKQQVITAIKDLGLNVTCGDVAVKTALPVLRVGQLLNNIAYETQGHLAVDTAGSVMYKFDSAFESRYLLNPTKDFFAWLGRIAWNAIKYAFKLFVLATFLFIRVSFGILLILSVVVVIVLVVAVIVGAIASLFGDSGGDSGGDANFDTGSLDWLGGMRFWAFDWCWDWWYWGDYLRDDTAYGGYRYNTGGSGFYGSYTSAQKTTFAEPEQQPKARKSRSNFLDNCFSVLFGAPDPNAQWDTLRWSIVGRAIKAHSGVVIAEDIAPYLDATEANEDHMLPVLVRFNGFPEVSETGKIIYVFPSLVPENRAEPAPTGSTPSSADDLQNIYSRFLARQTVQKTSENQAATLPPFVSKERKPLVGINENEAVTVVCFAAVAMGGALWLLSSAMNVPYIHMLRPVLLAVAAYGGSFFLFPAMRWPFIMHENARITAENEHRSDAAQKLVRPDSLLRSWQAEAAQLRTSLVSGEAKSIAYTTEEDSLAQQFAPPQQPNSPPLKLH